MSSAGAGAVHDSKLSMRFISQKNLGVVHFDCDFVVGMPKGCPNINISGSQKALIVSSFGFHK